jgi:2-polyprenyl-3-methyl-5-hydroxy-6-metoxy-1,4-benzoquinol methylase
VVSGLINRFFTRLRMTVEPLEAEATLDAGCGEGETIARLEDALGSRIVAVDLNRESVDFTANRLPHVDTRLENVYDLPFDAGEFDLVLCLEVLEHLEDPEDALTELGRVSRKHVVISVPHEPWFRLGSLLRGNYVSTLGNHPEHLNHWHPGSLRQLLARRLAVVSVRRSFPWLIAHCRAPGAVPEKPW